MTSKKKSLYHVKKARDGFAVDMMCYNVDTEIDKGKEETV